MKLIYISHWRFPSGKTTTPFTLRTLDEFANLGYEVELWIPRRYNPDDHGQDIFTQYNLQNRFAIKKLPVIDLMRFFGTFGFILMVASFAASVFIDLQKYKNKKDVVVYTQDMRDALLPSFVHLPLFIEIHDFYESSMRFVNKRVLAHASGLIVTNRIKIERLNTTYGFSKDKMLWQPNAVDADFFDSKLSMAEARTKLNLPQKGNIVLYTGHIYSWKGVDTLVESAKYLSSDTALYIVGGTTEDRARLQKLAANQNSQNVVFVEHQPIGQIPLYMRAANVVVLPNTGKEDASKFETSPVKLFEYLASGTPVVSSDLPSIREIVSEKEVTFAEADNAQSFAKAIQTVLAGGTEVQLKTVAGKVFARAHGWAARAKNINQLIERTINT